MSGRHAKLFLFLAAGVVILLLLFIGQWRKTRAIVVNASPTQLLSAESFDIPISADDPVLGNPGAPLTLAEFIDLGDAKSRTLHTTLADFVNKNPQKVRLVWKDFPQNHIFGGNATTLHRAAWCAGEQKHFWDFIAVVSKKTPSASESALLEMAAALGVDRGRWQACMESAPPATLADSATLAKTLGLPSAPALFVNNKQLDLTQDINLSEVLASFIAP